MSNNPFRNRITTQSPPATSPRPISTNPFLDVNELGRVAGESNHHAVTSNNTVDKAADIFVRVESHDKEEQPL